MAAVVGCSGGGGRIIGIDAQLAVPITLSIDGGDLSQLGVATGVQASQQIAAQFQNALSDAIYITPFGDVPGEIRVAFIANRKCEEDTSSGFGFIQYYLDNRLLPDKNKAAVTVVIGSGSFRSFLVAMTINSSSGRNIPLVEGTLIFRGWPE
jgi:hypothetical protein